MKRAFLYTLIALTRLLSNLPLLGMFTLLHFQKEGSGRVSDALWNAIMFFVFAVLHSLMARNFFKNVLTGLIGEHYVRIFFVVSSGISLTLLLYLWRPLAGSLWRAEGVFYWILTAGYTACIGAMIYTTFFIDYLEFLGIRTLLRTIRNRPSRPPSFSARGPYAYCRHPMYLFLLLALWLGPEMTYGRFEFAFMGSLYLVVGAFFEERNLRRELGGVYSLYCENVPMWIPRLKPWKYEKEFMP